METLFFYGGMVTIKGKQDFSEAVLAANGRIKVDKDKNP